MKDFSAFLDKEEIQELEYLFLLPNLNSFQEVLKTRCSAEAACTEVDGKCQFVVDVSKKKLTIVNI